MSTPNPHSLLEQLTPIERIQIFDDTNIFLQKFFFFELLRKNYAFALNIYRALCIGIGSFRQDATRLCK